jgi:hypothetical protein
VKKYENRVAPNGMTFIQNSIKIHPTDGHISVDSSVGDVSTMRIQMAPSDNQSLVTENLRITKTAKNPDPLMTLEDPSPCSEQ